MTFHSLALKNVKENWRSYSAFFLSSVFSVAIFYIYIAFITHPDIVNGNHIAAAVVSTGMKYCLYIIGIFSFIFILYSSSAFIKTRKKEFGLFSLFGMTRMQLRRLVFIENMMIGTLSTVVGIAVGILFSKLFFMALSTLLKLTTALRFALPLQAIMMTTVVFVGIFFVITIYTTFRIGKGQIISLLQAHKQPKKEPRYSVWLVLLGAFSIIGGYGLATKMNPATFSVIALPILILVIWGTYLLYTQLSVVVLSLLKRSKRLYYNRSTMLIIAQLGYKIKDNARILFTITILSAVVMTAMGTVYIIQIMGKKNATMDNVYTIGWVESEGDNKIVDTKALLQQTFDQHKQKIKQEVSINGLSLKKFTAFFPEREQRLGTDPKNNYESNAIIINQTTYNQFSEQKMELAPNEVGVVSSSTAYIHSSQGEVTGELNGVAVQYKVAKLESKQIMNSGMTLHGATIVMNDEQYDQLVASSSWVDRIVFYGIELEHWEQALPVIDELEERLPAEQLNKMDMSRIHYHQEFTQVFSLIIFIGLFISLLFFIAAGSLIYFKLFTERDEDTAMFKGLGRIGITFKEMKRVVVTQIGIIFFLPCIVGIIHALFAMIALDGMLGTSNWKYSFVVFGIYVVMQGLYFLLASRSYMQSIRKGSSTVSQ